MDPQIEVPVISSLKLSDIDLEELSKFLENLKPKGSKDRKLIIGAVQSMAEKMCPDKQQLRKYVIGFLKMPGGYAKFSDYMTRIKEFRSFTKFCLIKQQELNSHITYDLKTPTCSEETAKQIVNAAEIYQKQMDMKENDLYLIWNPTNLQILGNVMIFQLLIENNQADQIDSNNDTEKIEEFIKISKVDPRFLSKNKKFVFDQFWVILDCVDIKDKSYEKWKDYYNLSLSKLILKYFEDKISNTKCAHVQKSLYTFNAYHHKVPEEKAEIQKALKTMVNESRDNFQKFALSHIEYTQKKGVQLKSQDKDKNKQNNKQNQQKNH